MSTAGPPKGANAPLGGSEPRAAGKRGGQVLAAPRTRVQRRPVHGVLLLDKPLGLSSSQALQKAKWLLRAEKAGHTGTLDPLASGVLPLCFGAATKFSQLQLEADKTYETIVRLGVNTSTADAEGDVVQQRPVRCTAGQVVQVLDDFTGPIAQVPPMHSALKKDGKALYEYARDGETVERTPRQVVIHDLELLDMQLDGEAPQLHLRVRCSKGTYIRTLGEDIGNALGCGGHLTMLRRVETGGLHVRDAITLEQLEALDETARLQAIQASWTDADKEALCVQNEKLTAWQQTPDTAEQLATLPVLSLSEISADPLLIPAAEAQCGAAKVITHDLSMNGITIMHWYISLTDFTLDELKRLSILPELLGKLPTKRHDSLSLFQAIKRDIGKLTFQLRVMSRCAEMATPVLDVSCSVLDANVDKAAALVREILTETCFDDRARVQTLILQLSEMAKQKVISDGHRMAMYAASATMSAASAAREALNGLSACMVQKALAENFDAQYADFLALCERFSKDSAVQSRVTFSLSTNKALDPAAILSAYPVGTPIPDAAPYVSDLPAKCAYRIPSQISFASLGYDYRRAGKVYSGIARVMSNILSLSYLWNEVRVQGGAYGAGLNTSETGRMVTYSYRDPSPARTLGIDRSLSKGLRDFVAGDERIDKYISSTVGESEPPLGSENQILVSDENLLCGITPEDLCRERAEMLSTTKDALLKWCGVLDQMAKDGGVCVIGHDGAIAACEKEDLTVL